jgi:ion channel
MVKYKIPLIKSLYFVINFLQKFTSTFIIKEIFKNKVNLFKGIITALNILWFIFIIIILFFQIINPFIVTLCIFRLWEMFITNVYIFFREHAKKVSNTLDAENNTRLLTLLMIQYFSIILIYSYIFKCLEKKFDIPFQENPLSLIDAIYLSIVTIGNGDIGPIGSLTKIIVISEIFFGALYLVMFISIILSNIKLKWKK